MKIGVVGPIWLPIPPATYGGTEQVVYNLVEGLVEKGHDVTLFGPADANVHAKVFGTVKKPLRKQNVSWTEISYSMFHMTTAFDHADEFDILHVHINKSQDYIALALALASKKPVVFTLHFRLPSPAEQPARYNFLLKYKAMPFISISNAQRDDLPLNYISTVYNGLNMSDYPFSAHPKDFITWIGKINPFKGTKEAILAAKKAHQKMILMGPVDEGVPDLSRYFHQEVAPLIDNKQIRWIGEVDVKEKATVLGQAKGFLNPIQWEEPFGLVMTEAMATGTPVISFNRGAAPELIVDGKTGFLVDTLDEMVGKIADLDNIDRHACRAHIEKHFTRENMIDDYLTSYQIAISQWDQYKKEQQKLLVSSN